MKTTIKNFSTILAMLTLLFMSSCRETKKENDSEDIHMENTEHMDDSEHHDMDDGHLNENQDHMDDADDHMETEEHH